MTTNSKGGKKRQLIRNFIKKLIKQKHDKIIEKFVQRQQTELNNLYPSILSKQDFELLYKEFSKFQPRN